MCRHLFESVYMTWSHLQPRIENGDPIPWTFGLFSSFLLIFFLSVSTFVIFIFICGSIHILSGITPTATAGHTCIHGSLCTQPLWICQSMLAEKTRALGSEASKRIPWFSSSFSCVEWHHIKSRPHLQSSHDFGQWSGQCILQFVLTRQ